MQKYKSISATIISPHLAHLDLYYPVRIVEGKLLFFIHIDSYFSTIDHFILLVFCWPLAQIILDLNIPLLGFNMDLLNISQTN